MLFVAKSRESIIQVNHVEGPPDLIVELVAAKSFTRDWQDKCLDYEKAGVREYWVVDKRTGRMEVYALDRSGAYRAVAEKDGRFSSVVLPGFFIRPKWVLGGPLVSRRSALRELGVKG
jgi:Uma2 family endonuclease